MKKLSYKEYMKLRETPFEELSKKDQELRLKDFKKRVGIGMKFIRGLMTGYIPKSVTDEFPDDDPLKEESETVRIMYNNRHNKGEA